MNYYVRLLLDSDAHESKNVQLGTVNFPIYNAYPNPVEWLPLIYNNLAVFYENEKNKEDFLNVLNKFLLNNYRSVDLNYFIFDGSFNTEGFNKFFNVKTYRWGLSKFLDDIIAFREDIKERMLSKGHVEAFDRKATVIIFDFDDVKDKPVFIKMLDVLKNSRSERIFPILLMKNAKSFPKQLHKMFDLAVYLGKENQVVCDFIYADLGYGFYDIQQEHIGTAFVRGARFLVPVHPWEYTQSELSKKKEAELNKEYDDYLDFLKNFK